MRVAPLNPNALYVSFARCPLNLSPIIGSMHLTIYMPDVVNSVAPLSPLGDQKHVAFIRSETDKIDMLGAEVYEPIVQRRGVRSALNPPLWQYDRRARGGGMTRVPVSGSVLRWALERSGQDPFALRKKLPSLPEWLEGQSQPTLRQLETFARATSTPLGYLFLAEPPDERLPIHHFRTVSDRHARPPSPDLLDTVHTMQRRQAWMREHLIEEGGESLPFVRSATPREEPRTLAEKIPQYPRSRTKLGGPRSHLDECSKEAARAN